MLITMLTGVAALAAYGAWIETRQTRKEVTNIMAEINEITGEVYDAVLAIAAALQEADPGDKEQIESLQAEVGALMAKTAAFSDPDRLARTQAFLDAAAAATPSEE